MLGSLFTLDGFDGYAYNNVYAAGNQMYPHGINKYYDMHSFEGLLICMLDVSYVLFWNFLSAFTLFIPLYRWLEIFQLFEGKYLPIDWGMIIIPQWAINLFGKYFITVAPGVMYG